MKFLTLVLFLALLPQLNAQDDVFDAYNFNKKYLEHLVKTGVDEVRKNHDCDVLVNDSILYVASDHHSQYMLRKKRLTHNETDLAATKTPQLRAEYFGAKNYSVGENVLYVPFNSEVKNKKGKKFDTHTYQGIADAMVDSWVNSPGHFKNMITADYQITGLTVSLDIESGRIYACQKFAKVAHQFQFEENEEMFNYSEYTPPPVVSSFDGIPDQLIANHTYPFKLKHDKLEKCAHCEVLEAEKPNISLRVERKKFILKVENSAYVQQLIRDRKDGFAVEIVSFDDYMCGNPAYYSKPSRRNGQLRLNGFTLEPLYRKELFKGYKKRKKKKDVKFLPYIFRKDSSSFFRRFGQYKADRYSSEYFEISLGRVPKDVNYWNHNLVYIQNKQICDIDYFTSFCGELYSDYQESEFIPLQSERSYSFRPKEKITNFTIPFEQGQVDFTQEDIEPLLESFGELKYNIDSIEIHAYASIEGDSIINERLQRRRAENITRLIQSRQENIIELSVLTSTDWLGFTTNANKSAKWRFLANKSSSELEEYLKSHDANKLEPILAPTRRGDVRLYATIPSDQKNYPFLIKEENKRLLDLLNYASNPEKRDSLFRSIEHLYEFAHYLVLHDSLSIEELAKFRVPEFSKSSPKLIQQYILYGYEFEDTFSQLNPLWRQSHEKDMAKLHGRYAKSGELLPEFLYQLIRVQVDNFKQKPPSKQEQVQGILTIMQSLQSSYQVDTAFRWNIDQLNFDLNVMLLNEVFPRNPDLLGSGHDASKSIAQLYEYYKKYNQMTDSVAIALTKCAVEYGNIDLAVRMLQPYATSDATLDMYMQLGWNHPSEEQWSDYYATLIQLHETMSTDIWCNMFMGNCRIPFQAFDHEELRNLFCESCMDKNEEILRITGR
ncbi:MAG: CAP domain-containing protein [Crocinitomicaceae bacterium]